MSYLISEADRVNLFDAVSEWRALQMLGAMHRSVLWQLTEEEAELLDEMADVLDPPERFADIIDDEAYWAAVDTTA